MMIEKLNETGEYIYLIQERESIRCNDNIYKIGKTKQKPMKRVSAYPTGSKLWITIIVNNSTTAEKDLLTLFKHKFKQITSIGNEYFYGNPVEMINEIMNYQISHFKLGSEIEEQVKKKVDGVKNDEVNGNKNNKDVKKLKNEMKKENNVKKLNDDINNIISSIKKLFVEIGNIALRKYELYNKLYKMWNDAEYETDIFKWEQMKKDLGIEDEPKDYYDPTSDDAEQEIWILKQDNEYATEFKELNKLNDDRRREWNELINLGLSKEKEIYELKSNGNDSGKILEDLENIPFLTNHRVKEPTYLIYDRIPIERELFRLHDLFERELKTNFSENLEINKRRREEENILQCMWHYSDCDEDYDDWILKQGNEHVSKLNELNTEEDIRTKNRYSLIKLKILIEDKLIEIGRPYIPDESDILEIVDKPIEVSIDENDDSQVKKKVDETETQVLFVANGMSVELINDGIIESSAENLDDGVVESKGKEKDLIEMKHANELIEVKQMKPTRLIDVFPNKISDSNSISIDEECANEDIDEVINKIKKPISLSRYTKILASEIKNLGYKNDCSANIYIKFNGTNIFDVDYVDIMNKNGVIERTLNVNGNSVDIHTDADEDGTKIELNAYHINNKFKKVKVKDLNNYIINVCSFRMRKFKGAWYYKTIILPDKGGNK